MKHYTLAVDPPWNERGGGKIKRGADRHYPLLKSNEDIKHVLEGSELWPDIGKGDTASLWLWATANFLDDAIRLCGMLGFEYVTNAVWIKAHEHPASGQQWTVYPQAPGLGQRLRMCHEHLLYARAGRVPSPPPSHRLPSTIYAPRARHSAKPPEAYDLMRIHEEGVVDSIVGSGGSPVFDGWERFEFFARAPRHGWEVWGNEVL